MTQLAGIFGYPLSHSLSPAFQQAAFNYYGLDVRYLAWETPPEALAELVVKLHGGDFIGANVTIPHKESVIALLDEIDPLAQSIGAVNTIVKRGGRLVGHNTDAPGFMRALKEDGGIEPAGKRALILGAGGAARAAAFALCREGVSSITIANRNVSRAEALAESLHNDAVSVLAAVLDDTTLEPVALESDLIVNCTSVGMRHGESEGQTPLSGGIIPHEAVVMDMVYNPQNTPFLAGARNAGATALGGLPMLIYQGATAFEMWTGNKAPIDAMFAAGNVALLKMG
ncbi:MAG: shikimate dehydrogenase [Chloroflexota bacterium]|nr:shikimate dehydrogenase [Chloroflexota bacterium]